MKKYILVVFLSSHIGLAQGNYFDDWSSEDFCRWLDAPSVPENISEEMYARKITCDDNSKIIELTVKTINTSKYATALPSPKVLTPSEPKFRFRLNYKITL